MVTIKVLFIFLCSQVYFQGSSATGSIFTDKFTVTLVSTDENGDYVLNSLVGPRPAPDVNAARARSNRNLQNAQSMEHSTFKVFETPENNSRTDYLEIPGHPLNLTMSNTRMSTLANSQAIVETVIVVDKEFGDVFGQDYWKVLDYLTIYFWDVNMRYKSLWSVDVSFRINGLLIMESKDAQPFIENARGSDGRTEHNRILNLFKMWIYQQRSWLVRHDLAVAITNSVGEWGGGLAWGGGVCNVDTNQGIDWGTTVWNDDGRFGSVTVGAHEMAHTVGAPHDDDPNANCPGPYGFIMSGGNDDYRYFFQKCSNNAISGFVNSDRGACLRRIDGWATTPMDPNFSSPKAGNMQEACKLALNNPDAWIEQSDTFNCKSMRCLRRDENNSGTIWIHMIAPVENVQCGNGGRCFRGKCRKESKLLRNIGSGLCIKNKDNFGFAVSPQMVTCPSSKDKTPLDTFEIIDGSDGTKLLGSPFMNDENKENGDRCVYAGNADGGWLWTDRCSTSNPWHSWEFKGDQNRFQLVHKVTGRCAKPITNGLDSHVQSVGCGTSNDFLWSWVDGN